MVKARLSITLDEGVLKQIDSLVDGIVIKSRSEAVERFLRDRLKDRKTAVILAGGEPQTLKVGDVYRPLIKIKNQTLVEHISLKAREAGYYNQIVVGHPEMIAAIYSVLGDGKKHDITVTYVEDRSPMGSAKTLEKIKDHVKSDFVLLPIDTYFEFDLSKIRDYHTQHNGVVTLAVHTRRYDSATHLGIVEMEGSKIINFEEKPKNPKTNLHSTMIGVFSREIFDYIPPGHVSWSLQTDIFPKLVIEGKMVGYPTAGKWVNVHTKKDIDMI